ncbi:MAG: prepilin-type N-terminal cleavage/methylation domain-containing protein, partial [Candidatus Eremiobacterota bacterium]
MRLRGFSLVELLVALSVLMVILGLSLAGLGRARASATSRGLAEVVAEELRLARRAAIARQVPVAVAFPSAGGTLGHSQSLYVLEGEAVPRLTRVVNLAGDFPGACVFLGTWGVNGAALRDPSQTVTRTQPWSGLAPVAWSQGTSDWVFVFLPTGRVTSNGAPLFDAEYHLLACQGLDYQGAGPPPGQGSPPISYFAPRTVSLPLTIAVSALGEVSVLPGVVANDGSVTEVSTALPVPVSAAPPVLGPLPNGDPRILNIDLAPRSPISGGDVVLTEGDHLTMRVAAADPDGDPLWCSW